jgi:hypothetical protein
MLLSVVLPGNVVPAVLVLLFNVDSAILLCPIACFRRL